MSAAAGIPQTVSNRARLRLGKAVMVPVWSSGFIVGALAVRHASSLTALSGE